MESDTLYRVGGTCLNVCSSIIKLCFTEFFLLRWCEARSHKVIWATNRLVLKWSSYGFVLISTRKKNEFEMHLPAADRNLIKSRANSELEVLLATGCKLQLFSYWIYSFIYLFPFFSWLGGPDLQAELCKALLVFSAFLWLLWEFCLSEDCKTEPSLLKNCINPISNISKSLKGKLEWELLVLSGMSSAIRVLNTCCKHCICYANQHLFVSLLMPFTCNDWKRLKWLDIWHFLLSITTLLEIPTWR